MMSKGEQVDLMLPTMMDAYLNAQSVADKINIEISLLVSWGRMVGIPKARSSIAS